MKILHLGIDEAGRGPVIGPMIMAGCLLDEDSQKKLKQLGVKDSKELTQKRREFLYSEITKMSESYRMVRISPDQIEKYNLKGVNLNQVEAIAIAKIIDKLNNGSKKIKVVVDCPSVSILPWKDYLKTKIKNLSNLEIVCEHKADKNYVCVSAASVLAKCTREKEMDKLKKEYGAEIGSGYSSDPTTIKFVAKYAKDYANKGIFRKTWKTWKVAYEKLSQHTL